ncbi:tetratricopeptide repeat protein [Winogradskyella pulchriflava]|uniref:Tol-pal system YbgF family protein n=1 Tax=Winogradskyella pulchriflava TaxID=1110688 RepID=A0ABV6QCM4_9FLAO
MDLNDISQEEFEKIEAFINGQLSEEDLSTFENKLKNEDGFKAKVEDIKAILNGIETQAMKEQLDEFHTEISSNEEVAFVNEPRAKSLNWKRIAIAAILIIGLGSFWLFNGNSNDRLYAKYFTPDPGLPTTMSSNEDNYEFYEAMVNYKQGDYKTALTKWKTLQNKKPNNDTINYFIGVAHLANKNENDAISFLENAIEDSNFPLLNDAFYYLGLAYLKTGNIDKAKANLQNSTIDNSKALLSELND